MDTSATNRLGMFRKVQHFLSTHEATLAVNPAIIDLKNNFNTIIETLSAHAVTSTTDFSGYTEVKQTSRAALRESCLRVASALFSYLKHTATEAPLDARSYTKRELRRASSATLYTRATQLHQAADPVKALLAPYGCTPADVDALHTHKEKFLDDDTLPRTMFASRSSARKEMLARVQQGRALLKTLDIYLRPFANSNATLHSQYLTARAIDNLGGKRKKKKEPDPADTPEPLP